MTQSLPPHERRSDRRLQMGSPARILFDDAAPVDAECVELSVGGMTLRSAYVPGEAEVLTVEVYSPPGGLERPPLIAHLRVKRCHMVSPGDYEVGGEIVEVIG
tara:strand:- start:2265 stop:2573 length:309 start_codon:yes stop_codon:yes gene_type:complete